MSTFCLTHILTPLFIQSVINTNIAKAGTENTYLPSLNNFNTMKNFNSNSTSPNEILSKINETVSAIDWLTILNKDADENVQKREKIVAIVDHVRSKAAAINHNLCYLNSSINLYTGAYWSKIEDSTLSEFLGNGAHRMGIDEIESRYFGFRDLLVKQFKNVAKEQLKKPASDGILINLRNGTLVIKPTGYMLKEFDHTDFLTYQLPFKFDKDAEAPVFEKFLNRVLPDTTMQQILAEYIGYVFIPNSVMKLEKVLMLVGEGANGKSTFYDIITGLLGRDNITSYSMNNLTGNNGYYRAKINNILLNYSSEISTKMDSTIFKQLASGEAIEARLPYGEPMILENYARLIFNTNGLPVDVEHNHAFFRRFLLIPFNVTIPKEEQDKHLAQKIIKNELPGVLNWVLNGLDRLVKQDRFTYSEAAENALNSYRKESDTVLLFLEEYGYAPNKESKVALKEMYSQYKSFCSDNNYKALGNKNFKKRIESEGFECNKENVGQVVNAVITIERSNEKVTYEFK